MPLSLEGKLGVFRIAVKDKISIAPRSEVIVTGKVLEHREGILDTGIIEPYEDFVKKDIALVAKTLVKVTDTVPVRLMNVSDHVKILGAGTVVGNISHEKVLDSSPSNSENLLAEAGKHLTQKDKLKIKDLQLD